MQSFFIILLSLCTFNYSCGTRSSQRASAPLPEPTPEPTLDPTPTPTPTPTIQPSLVPRPVESTQESIQRDLVNSKCASCHMSATAANRFVALTDVSKIYMPIGEGGGVHHHEPGAARMDLVVPGCPDQSLFLSIMKEGKMPKAPSPKIDDKTLIAVRDWIIGLKPNASESCDTGEPGVGTVEPGEPD